MSKVLGPRIFWGLLLGAVICLFLSVALSFRAGCAGDMKTGAVGDIQLAMQFGTAAIVAMLAGMSLGAAAFLVRSDVVLSQRSAHALAWFCFSGVFTWLAAFQAEVWGVQSCF